MPEGVEVGTQLQAGQQQVTVTAIDGDEVTVDFNHQLAGAGGPLGRNPSKSS